MPTSAVTVLEQEVHDLGAEEGAILTNADAAAARGDSLSAEQMDRLGAIQERLPIASANLASLKAARDRRSTEPAIPADAAAALSGALSTEAIGKAPTPFGSFGEQLEAIRTSAIGAKRGVPADSRLALIQDHFDRSMAAGGLNETVGNEGGFAVQQDYNESIVSLIDTEATLWPAARPVPLSANSNGMKLTLLDETSRATGSRWGGVQVYWEAEATTATAKKPKVSRLDFTLQKLFGLAYRTDETGEDWQASGSLLESAFASEIAFSLDDGAFRGTGAGQPLGILNAPATITVNKETGQVADTLVAENVFNMFSRMPARSKQRAAWYVNGELWPQIFQLAQVIGTGGVPLFIPTGAIGDTPGGSLLGRPIVEIEQASAIGDLGDIAFLDMSQYLRLEKGGIQRASSIHVEFLTDQEVFRWIYRTNGRPGWNSAVTRYKGTTTVSPFVILQAR